MYTPEHFDFINTENIPESVFQETLMPLRNEETDRYALQFIDYLFLLEAYQQRMHPFKDGFTSQIVVTDAYRALNFGNLKAIMNLKQGGVPTIFGLRGPNLFGNESAYCFNWSSLTSSAYDSAYADNIETMYFGGQRPLESVTNQQCNSWVNYPHNRWLTHQVPMCMYTDIRNMTRLGVSVPASYLFNSIRVTQYSSADGTSSTSYLNLTNQYGNTSNTFYEFGYAYKNGEYYTKGVDYYANQKSELDTKLIYASNTATLICKVNTTFSTTSGTDWYSAYICIPCICIDGVVTLPSNILNILRSNTLSVRHHTIGSSSTHKNCLMTLTQIMMVFDMNFKTSISFS